MGAGSIDGDGASKLACEARRFALSNRIPFPLIFTERSVFALDPSHLAAHST